MNYYGMTLTDPAAIQDALVAQVQMFLDQSAKEYGYESILSAISYRNDPNPRFAAEAEGFITLRSESWTRAYARLAQVEAGAAHLPTLEELAGLLPTLNIQYPS